MDQAAVALRRSDQVLLRAVVAGLLTLAGVVAFGAAGVATAREILVAWVVAALAACVIGFIQISRATGGYRFRPRLPGALTRRLLSVGVPNFALTAADNAPGLILPIVVAGALSARAAAFWYVAWMMALAAYTVPISFGLHLFAEISDTPLELVRHLRDSLRLGIPVAGVATVGLVTLGPLVLSILGSGYADHGSTPLRLVALAAMPMVVTKSYLAVCRGTGRIREGTVFAGIVGTAAVCLALWAAQAFGLSGIAATWLTVQVIAAVGAAVRLRTLAWRPSRGSEATIALSTGTGS
jgi:O-antigen/teichoic acid export membrane protein